MRTKPPPLHGTHSGLAKASIPESSGRVGGDGAGPRPGELQWILTAD